MKLKFSKVITDNNKLVKEKEELKDKYDNLKEINTSGQAKIENLKRRLDEVLVDKKEFEDRIDTLEERLSQTRTLLQERTRDASTMRKLLKQGDHLFLLSSFPSTRVFSLMFKTSNMSEVIFKCPTFAFYFPTIKFVYVVCYQGNMVHNYVP